MHRAGLEGQSGQYVLTSFRFIPDLVHTPQILVGRCFPGVGGICAIKCLSVSLTVSSFAKSTAVGRSAPCQTHALITYSVKSNIVFL